MPNALIVGASRGIGLGLVEEFAKRGWSVVGTVRGEASAGDLKMIARDSGGKITLETVDTADAASGMALRGRLGETQFDLILVNAGVGGPADKTPRDVTDAEFTSLFITNSLGPVRLAELLAKNVTPQTGVVGLMTSQLGSIAGNVGGYELYRASKAALNSFTRSFAARHKDKGLTVLSLHPGWVRTDMGGANAAIDVATSVKGLADVVERAQKDRRDGFFDYSGKELPW